jgi:hypothetical protein
VSVNRKFAAEKAEPGMNRGLGVPPDLNIERALEIARDAHDAKVMRDLRADLDALMDRPNARALSRENVLALLRTISESLDLTTQKLLGATTEGEVVMTSHPAVALLDGFVDALSDLDRGKTDPSLRACSDGPNASLTTSERKWDDALLEAVLIVQRARGLKTRAEAENLLAGSLNRAEKKQRGKVYTPRMLKRLRDDRAKRK